MSEFYIVAHSFAAPFFSDESRRFIEADTPRAAINNFRESYKHPCGLFAAVCYQDANAEAKGEKPLAKWLCNHEIAKERLTRNLGSYSYLGEAPGKFRINDKWHNIPDPKGGDFVPVR